MIRFNEKNFANLVNQKKNTTIRTHAIKLGLHSVIAGSRYKPKELGHVFVEKLVKECGVRDLTQEDAENDGFPSRDDLLIELGRLNKGITAQTPVFVYSLRLVQDLNTELK